MRKAGQEIAKLCQRWWTTLNESTRSEQERFVLELLALLGWDETEPTRFPELNEDLVTTHVFQAGGQAGLAAHFLLPGTLEAPASLEERALDFCPATRRIVSATRKHKFNYTLITDFQYAYLYHVKRDVILLAANSPAEFERDIAPSLQRKALENGALEELRRPPRSQQARLLRSWFEHWENTISDMAPQASPYTDRLFDRLVVLRYLLLHDVLKRPGRTVSQRFANVVKSAFNESAGNCGRLLTALFHDMWFDWKADIFAVTPALDDALKDDALARPLIREFSLLSRGKFDQSVVLESFNFGDASEKARVRLIPEPDEERDRFIDTRTLDNIAEARIDLDINDEGYRAITYWFDKLLATYERLDATYEAKGRENVPPVAEMDLFAWSEINANRPDALVDHYRQISEYGLRVFCGTPRQERTARLLLYLHIIDCYERNRRRFESFPPIEKALQPRPAVMRNDRRSIFGGDMPLAEEA